MKRERENKNRQHHHNHNHNHHHRIYSRGALFYFPARNFEFLTKPSSHIIHGESRKRRARRLTIITTTNARRSRLARLQRTFAHLSLSASFISSRKQRKRERKEIQKKTYQSFHIRQGLGVILHRVRVAIHRRQLRERTVLRYDRRRV